MKSPIWFDIIAKWKEMEMGEYGVTFPFLVGAVAKVNDLEITRSFVEDLFNEITNNPVPGYYCEVRWCGNIQEPVASIKLNKEFQKVSIRSHFSSNNDRCASLAFTTDLMSMFNLNCSTREQCLQKIIEKTLDVTASGTFSKNNGVFTAFTENDIAFIEKVNAK